MTTRITETAIPPEVSNAWIAAELRKLREEQRETHADVRRIPEQISGLADRVTKLEHRMESVEHGLGDLERGRELDLARRRARAPRRPWPWTAIVTTSLFGAGALALAANLLLRS